MHQSLHRAHGVVADRVVALGRIADKLAGVWDELTRDRVGGVAGLHQRGERRRKADRVALGDRLELRAVPARRALLRSGIVGWSGVELARMVMRSVKQCPRTDQGRVEARRLVRTAGVEPAQPCGRGILSPLRLPVSPRPRSLFFNILPRQSPSTASVP